ncbi:hypothetical protein [Mycobacterium uberis]|uniref:hypothetical protein n=1 Tax=Mycobacterium uberis TaxID=2162698 RepID=UPI0026B2353C
MSRSPNLLCHRTSAPPVVAGLLRQQFLGELVGDIDVLEILEKRDGEASSSSFARMVEVLTGVSFTRSLVAARILWLDNAAPDQLVFEVCTVEWTGLLALITWVLERAGVDIVWAKVNTYGSTAAYMFCVVWPAKSTRGVDAALRAMVEQHLLSVLCGCS